MTFLNATVNTKTPILTITADAPRKRVTELASDGRLSMTILVNYRHSQGSPPPAFPRGRVALSQEDP
jgi:hypothetical protein